MSPCPRARGRHLRPRESEALWWSLAIGADFGSNLTAIGASANVVVLGIARRSGSPISFWEFTRKGAIITVITVALAAPYLWLRFLFWPDENQRRWQPPDQVQQFLTDGPAPIYIGFGSMGCRRPPRRLGNHGRRTPRRTSQPPVPDDRRPAVLGRTGSPSRRRPHLSTLAEADCHRLPEPPPRSPHRDQRSAAVTWPPAVHPRLCGGSASAPASPVLVGDLGVVDHTEEEPCRVLHDPQVAALADAACADSLQPLDFGIEVVGVNVEMDAARSLTEPLNRAARSPPRGGRLRDTPAALAAASGRPRRPARRRARGHGRSESHR